MKRKYHVRQDIQRPTTPKKGAIVTTPGEKELMVTTTRAKAVPNVGRRLLKLPENSVALSNVCDDDVSNSKNLQLIGRW